MESEQLKEVLAKFGHADFREGQREPIEAVLRGEDAVVVMPTGAGKSLCYQVTALMLPGTTLVVSPLIALMKDQVDALERKGIAVTLINSTVGLGEVRVMALTATATPAVREDIVRQLHLGEAPRKPPFRFAAPDRRIDQCRGDALALQRIDLVLHERDER